MSLTPLNREKLVARILMIMGTRVMTSESILIELLEYFPNATHSSVAQILLSLTKKKAVFNYQNSLNSRGRPIATYSTVAQKFNLAPQTWFSALVGVS